MIFGAGQSNFILVFLCSIVSCAPDTLRLVNVLYRHGDRGPAATYPNDPYNANLSSLYPQGLGWLTETGMRQQFALGQFLRSEYGNFLNSTYKNSEIVVQASNVNRCLMSAYCNLAGLYPPVKQQQWNRQLNWQPIPVHTMPESEDNKLAMLKPCARYDDLYAKELHGPQVREEERVNKMFYEFLDNVTGVRRENISVLWKVADTLFVEKSHNLSLPAWTQEEWKNGTVYSKLMQLKDWSFALLFNGTTLSRLKGGPLLKEFIQNMQNAVNDSKDRDKQLMKMHMYSAHDTTVAAVLSAMQVYNRKSPPYATAVLVELHADGDDSHCVKIRFRNTTEQPPYTLVHPECRSECCPLEQFVEVTKARVPVNWEEECDNDSDDNSGVFAMSGTVLGLTVGVVVLALLLVMLFVGFLRQRRLSKTFELMED